MGKSKKRLFNRNSETNSIILKRSEIARQIALDIRSNSINNETMKYAGMFGITAEELAEAGASYEEISAVKHLIF